MVKDEEGGEGSLKRPGISKAKSRRRCLVCALCNLVYYNLPRTAEYQTSTGVVRRFKRASSRVEVTEGEEEDVAVGNFVRDVAQKILWC